MPPIHKNFGNSLKPSQVETYSGSRLHERPRRFTWEGQWLEVQQVRGRWREPGRLFFQVLAADGQPYLLVYHSGEDAWYAGRGRRSQRISLL